MTPRPPVPAHTPAPWRHTGTGIDARAFDGTWKWITPVIHGGTPEQATANRALMAAAPDLLAALKSAVEVIKTWHSIHDCDETAWDIYEQHAPEMKPILAAIAKAEGR